MKRIQKQYILKDLTKKMVFVAGPRQSGKTWLAKSISSDIPNSLYLNYDSVKDQKIIHDEAWLESCELLIFDELHKMPNWKNYIKGVYDTKPQRMKILVTGSARFEISQQFGDSLAGRYFLHHLMPLSPAEITQTGENSDLDRLVTCGNFPEPYLADDPIEAKRWRQQYTDSLLREDVLNFDEIQNVRAIRLVFELLREKVGSPISYQSIAEDAHISPNTVKKYISILEALYIVFRVTPYSKNIARSLIKEPKLYFFDVGLVRGDSGTVFENLVAVCLLKHVYARNDYYAEDLNLHYLRTKEQYEVDFALTQSGEIKQMIEAKYTDEKVSKSLKYFHEKYDLPAIQLVRHLKHSFRSHLGISVIKAEDYLSGLAL